MSSTDDTVPRVLVPAENDIPSRRHHVILRRAEKYIEEFVAVVDQYLSTVAGIQSVEVLELLRDKREAILQGFDELKAYIVTHPQTSIIKPLEVLRDRFATAMRAFNEMQGKAGEAHH